MPKKKEPLPVSLENPALKFLIKVRDEVHRFTNKIHVKKRNKEHLKSRLSLIKGFGPKKISFLMTHFESIQDLLNCSENSFVKFSPFTKNDYDRVRNAFLNEKSIEDFR